MATYPIDIHKLRKNLSYTLFAEHLKKKDETIEDTLGCNIEFQMLQDKCTRIHKNSMIRDCLYKAANEFVVDFRLDKFGNTHAYVEECIENKIRATQKQIYNLYATFNNDRFRQDEMFENKGELHEYYYDRMHTTINSWRGSIEKEVDKIRLVFTGEMEEMKINAQTMKRKEFILYPSYVDFFGDRTLKSARDAPGPLSPSKGGSKKRKQPPQPEK